jgi:CDP-diglyceride synthetase
MKPFNQHIMRPSSSTNVGQIFQFILRTCDGWYLIFLCLMYFAWTIYSFIKAVDGSRLHSLAILSFPILFFVVYLAHRADTSASDRMPAFFSFISLTAFALVPFYEYFR